MREQDNPYEPGAGTPPPALVGRERLLDSLKIALERILAGRSAKSLMPTGLRGVGKTVLLNRFRDEAELLGFETVMMEASEAGQFAKELSIELRRLVLRLDRGERITATVKRLTRVFKSFYVNLGLEGVRLGIDVDAEVGVADSGDLTSDLTDLFEALGQAAKERGSGIFIAIDEVQYLSAEELSAVIMAIHRIGQHKLPIIVVGAGLPQLPGMAGDAKSYAERLFDFPIIAALSPEDAKRAIREPALEKGITFAPEALDELVRITEGYPYFLQEWAYRVWNLAERSPITLADAKNVEPLVVQRLDEGFFRVRFDRLTPTEKNYMRAMAELGPGPHRSGEIADSLQKAVRSLGPVRDSLIKKGMLYSPKYGEAAFTVPLFDAFMRRTMPMPARGQI